MNTDCGLIYMAWGKNAIQQAQQSIGSLRRFLPNMPVMVIGDAESRKNFDHDPTVEFYLCDVDPFDKSQKKGFQFLAGMIKPMLYKISPFVRTLYVDADTYFQTSPIEGFRLLDKWDVALAETQTRTLAQGVAGKEECCATADELGSPLLLYHNSGMIFFRKNKRTEKLFTLWAKEWQRYGGWDEQVALLRALLRSEAIFLTLPYTWNHPGLKECYFLTHWFGAGDARVDGVQRVRELEPAKIVKTKPSPLIRIELSDGQWIQCRPEQEAEVRKMYNLPKNRANERTIEMRKDPLVKVYTGRPGEYVKMRKSHAEKQGLPWEPEKRVISGENKMNLPEENKGAPSPKVDDATVDATNTDQVEPPAVDFTEISGVGPATDKALHKNGIHTLEALKTADIGFLSERMVRTIKKWIANNS